MIACPVRILPVPPAFIKQPPFRRSGRFASPSPGPCSSRSGSVCFAHEQEAETIGPHSRSTDEAGGDTSVHRGAKAEERGHDGAVIQPLEAARQGHVITIAEVSPALERRFCLYDIPCAPLIMHRSPFPSTPNPPRHPSKPENQTDFGIDLAAGVVDRSLAIEVGLISQSDPYHASVARSEVDSRTGAGRIDAGQA